jgi:hypothetical protein
VTTDGAGGKARAVYRHAAGFLLADVLLRQQVEADPDLAEIVKFAGMVDNTFASELFLKSLLLLDGKGEARGHNLKELYDQLSEEMKNKMRAEWAKMLSETPGQLEQLEKRFGVTIPRDLETSLSECGDAFVLLRYIYEKPSGATFYITQLPLVLKNVVDQITGWNKASAEPKGAT